MLVNLVSQEVYDYSVGIDYLDLPYIFERFYKGKNRSNDI